MNHNNDNSYKNNSYPNDTYKNNTYNNTYNKLYTNILSNKIFHMIVTVILLFIIGSVLITYITADNKNYKIYEIDKGWSIEIDGKKYKNINILEDIKETPNKDNKKVTLNKCDRIELTRIFKENNDIQYPIIAIHSEYSLIDVYVDNKKVVRNYKGDSSGFVIEKKDFYGRLPKDYKGKNLKLSLEINTNDSTRVLDDIYIMSENDYFLYQLRDNISKHISGTFMIILGIILLIINYVIPNKSYEFKRILWIGLIFLTGGVGIYAEFGLLNLYTNNVTIIENAKNVSILACVIYVLMMSNSLYMNKKLRQNMKIYTIVVSVIYAAFVILHNLGIYRYNQSSVVIRISIMVTILVLIYYNHKNIKKVKAIEKIYVRGLEVCYIEVVLTVIMYIFGSDKYNETIGKYHFVIILTTLFCVVMLYYVYVLRHYMDKITEKNVLLHSAYTDFLTGLQNRAKYEEVIEEMRQVELADITIVSFDLDNLKQINDKEGHDMGDKYIKSFAAVLKKYIDNFEYLGRIGGDEFMLVLKGKTTNLNNTLDKMKKAFVEEIEEVNWKDIAAFSYGLASGKEEKDVKDIDKLIEIADNRLYEYKAINKRKQKINREKSVNKIR